jgi:AraC-like DNA-binding protein
MPPDRHLEAVAGELAFLGPGAAMIPPRIDRSNAQGTLVRTGLVQPSRRRQGIDVPPHVQLHTATGGIARAAAAHAHARGLSVEPCLRRVKLLRRTLDDANERIPVSQQIAFLNAVSDALDDDELGFNLAQEIDLRELGLMYYVAASSGHVGRSLEYVERYCRIANECVAVTLPSAHGVRIQMTYSGVPRHSDRYQIEFFVAFIVRMCRELTAVPLRAVEAGFIHHRVRDLAYDHFFGCDVEFGAGADFVVFPHEARSLPLRDSDKYLNRVLVGICDDVLGMRNVMAPPWRTKVENIIGPLLPHGGARLQNVAASLGLSSRTLARRLAVEGTTFEAVLDALRRELALFYVRDPQLALGHVAWLLGFSDQSAFTHAFRRWTGKPPRTVRSERLASCSSDAG